MKYKSKKGTVINIPDGLTDKQIKDIKADADAGYGTRAQETADRLGAKIAKAQEPAAPTTPAAVVTPPVPVDPDEEGDVTGKTLQERIAILKEKIAKRKTNYGSAPEMEKRLAELQDQKKGEDDKGGGKTTKEKIENLQDKIDVREGNGNDATKMKERLDELKKELGGGSSTDTSGGNDAGGGDTGTGGGDSIIDSGVVNKKTGTVDPTGASEDVAEAEKKDVDTNFKLSQPQKITDQYGNVRTVTRDPVTGEVTITDELGGTAQKFRDLATAAAETFNGGVSRQRAEEATYGTLTKYYDRDQERESEQAKQELANRGIPYDPAAAQDPNSKNLYGRTIGGISERYRGLKDDASRQAILAGNQAYAVDSSARDSFLNAVTSGANTFSGKFGQYQNQVQTDSSQDVKDILALSSDAYMTKYGIDKDTYTKKLAIAKSGSSGSSSSQPTGGFEILG